MDAVDRKILSSINRSLPLNERPFAELAQHAGISEDEAIGRIRALHEAGIIRRIGAVVDPRKIGWVSTLCAADVPEEKLEAFGELAGRYDEVTHNYLRQGSPNCWFTIIAPDRRRVDAIKHAIEQAMDVKVLDFPATRVFKIRVAFDIE